MMFHSSGTTCRRLVSYTSRPLARASIPQLLPFRQSSSIAILHAVPWTQKIHSYRLPAFLQHRDWQGTRKELRKRLTNTITTRWIHHTQRCYHPIDQSHDNHEDQASPWACIEAALPEIQLVRSKRKLALKVAYLGTNYFGSTKLLEPDKPTVEGALEDALFKAGMIRESNFGQLNKIGWSRSSRTDRGVHSLGSFFSAKLEGEWIRHDHGNGRLTYHIDSQCREFPALINKHLPSDVRVLEVFPVRSSWDARTSCTQRQYQYILPSRYFQDSLYDRNPEAFQELASLYLGRHYWHNFGKVDTSKRKNYSHCDDRQDIECESLSESSAKDKTVDSDYNGGTIWNHSDCSDQTLQLGLPSSSSGRLSTSKLVRNWLTAESSKDESTTSTSHSQSMTVIPPFHDSYYRTIREFRTNPIMINQDSYIHFTLSGDSFIMHQIRRMIGALICVARGIFSPAYFLAAIDSPFGIMTPRAPSCGLVLANSIFHPSGASPDSCPPDMTNDSSLITPEKVYRHIAHQWQLLESIYPSPAILSPIATQSLISHDPIPSDSTEHVDFMISLKRDPWQDFSAIQPMQDICESIPGYNQWLSWYQHNKGKDAVLTQKREEKKARIKTELELKRLAKLRRNREYKRT